MEPAAGGTPSGSGSRACSATGLGCISGSTSAAGLRVVPCVAGAASQTWTGPSVGVQGTFKVHANMCLTAGGLNYLAMTWTCITGSASQQWTQTPTGEIKSPTGYCLSINRGTTSSTVSLRLCNGSVDQKWSRS